MLNMHSCSAVIFNKEMEPQFILQIYGVANLAFVGPNGESGGQLVKRGLREHGLNPDDFTADMFHTCEGPYYDW